MTRKQLAERQEYRSKLAATLSNGSTLYTLIRTRSRTGLSKTIDVYTIQDNELRRLTWWIATATGYRYDTRAEAIRTTSSPGEIVAELAHILYGKSNGLVHREIS